MAEKLYAVLTPVKNFKGRRFGVVFIDGKGMATKREATVLVKNWGYKCPELASTSSATDDGKGSGTDDVKGSATGKGSVTDETIAPVITPPPAAPPVEDVKTNDASPKALEAGAPAPVAASSSGKPGTQPTTKDKDKK